MWGVYSLLWDTVYSCIHYYVSFSYFSISSYTKWKWNPEMNAENIYIFVFFISAKVNFISNYKVF